MFSTQIDEPKKIDMISNDFEMKNHCKKSPKRIQKLVKPKREIDQEIESILQTKNRRSIDQKQRWVERDVRERWRERNRLLGILQTKWNAEYSGLDTCCLSSIWLSDVEDPGESQTLLYIYRLGINPGYARDFYFFLI